MTQEGRKIKNVAFLSDILGTLFKGAFFKKIAEKRRAYTRREAFICGIMLGTLDCLKTHLGE